MPFSKQTVEAVNVISILEIKKMILAQRRGSTIVPVAENEEMILTDAQYQAFQEAFELFDKNGGGTIDAAELQKTLDDCGIYVNGDDLGKIYDS